MPTPASIAAGLSGALLLSGGLICFSDHALPGDALYTIKTNVAEPLNQVIALSPADKAKVAMDNAETRLHEAAQVTADGNMTPEIAQGLVKNFQIAANEAEQNQAKVSESNAPAAAEAATSFKNMLNSNVDLLASLGAQASGQTKDALAQIEAAARAEAKDAGALSSALEGKVNSPDLAVDANADLKAAENAVANAQAKINNQKATLGATGTADANAQLNAAKHLLAEGRAKLNAKAYGQASGFFDAAAKLAGDASFYGDTLLNLSANGAANGDSVIQAVKSSGNAVLNVNSGVNASGNTNSGSAGVNANGLLNTGVNTNLNTNLPVNVNVNLY